MFYDGLKERSKIQSAVALRALFDLLAAVLNGYSKNLVGILDSDTLTGDTVKNGEIQLIVVCLQIHEEFVYFVHYLIDSGILLVQLIDEKDWIEPLFEGLLKHESGLRHGAF